MHQPGSIAAAWAGKCLERVVLDTVKVASLACQVECYGVGVLRSIKHKAAAVTIQLVVTEVGRISQLWALVSSIATMLYRCTRNAHGQ